MNNYPDWIQAISESLTVIITLIAIIKLFIRDKERESEIKSLILMSNSQSEINSNFITQIAEMQKQSLALSEANEILKQQLIISKKYYESDLNVTTEKFELEKNKRRNEIKPFFVFDGGSGDLERIKVKIKNTGQTAYNITISFFDCKHVNFSTMNNKMDKIVNDHTFALEGTKVNQTKNAEYSIKIVFYDEDDNKYSQTLSEINYKKIVSNPILIVDKNAEEIAP